MQPHCSRQAQQPPLQHSARASPWLRPTWRTCARLRSQGYPRSLGADAVDTRTSWAVTCEYEAVLVQGALRTETCTIYATCAGRCERCPVLRGTDAVYSTPHLETFAQRDPGQPIGFQQAQSTAHGGGSVLWRCRWRSCCGRPRTASSSCSARQRSGLSARCRTQHGTLQRSAAYRGVRCNAG